MRELPWQEVQGRRSVVSDAENGLIFPFFYPSSKSHWSRLNPGFSLSRIQWVSKPLECPIKAPSRPSTGSLVRHTGSVAKTSPLPIIVCFSAMVALDVSCFGQMFNFDFRTIKTSRYLLLRDKTIGKRQWWHSIGGNTFDEYIRLHCSVSLLCIE